MGTQRSTNFGLYYSIKLLFAQTFVFHPPPTYLPKTRRAGIPPSDRECFIPVHHLTMHLIHHNSVHHNKEDFHVIAFTPIDAY